MQVPEVVHRCRGVTKTSNFPQELMCDRASALVDEAYHEVLGTHRM